MSIPHEYYEYNNRPDRFTSMVSDDFVVQCFHVAGDIIRLAIRRREPILSAKLYADGIDRGTLGSIVQALGYESRCAVEIYPAACDILNIVNIRHLWLLPQPLLIFDVSIDDHLLAQTLESRDYQVDIYHLPHLDRRLCVLPKDPDLDANTLSWDVLQDIKDMVGFPGFCGVEIISSRLLNICNVRNIWLLREPLPFVWRICPQTGKVLNPNH